MNELAGQTLGGSYTLEEEVGHGSMGVVYRGKQNALGRVVAIKILPKVLARDASYVARFKREARIIAGLNHPNIVHIYDAGQHEKLLYFVMEYVEGPTLANLLHLDGMIPQHLAAEYAAQIADALHIAYSDRDVIHRDIKPENLMLDRWGKIKVMDFGLARATGLQQITMAKTLVGSIYYSSPEQIWGKELDNRSDIYALGVVLYEIVSGQRPFQGRSMPELTQAIVRGRPRPPRRYNPSISIELEQIILTALSLNREERYADAAALARELRRLDLSSQSAFLPMTGTTGEQQPVRERTVVQPPKRPPVRRPNYQLPNSPTRPTESSDSQASISQQLTARQPTSGFARRDLQAQEQAASPQLAPQAIAKHLLAEEIKTVPLDLLQKEPADEGRSFFRWFTRRTSR